MLGLSWVWRQGFLSPCFSCGSLRSSIMRGSLGKQGLQVAPLLSKILASPPQADLQLGPYSPFTFSRRVSLLEADWCSISPTTLCLRSRRRSLQSCQGWRQPSILHTGRRSLSQWTPCVIRRITVSSLRVLTLFVNALIKRRKVAHKL